MQNISSFHANNFHNLHVRNSSHNFCMQNIDYAQKVCTHLSMKYYSSYAQFLLFITFHAEIGSIIFI